MAEASVYVIPDTFGYSYARDAFILIDRLAFHPNYIDIYANRDDLSNDGDAWSPTIPLLYRYNYRPYELSVHPNYMYDGGNFVDAKDRDLLLYGLHTFFSTDPSLCEDLFNVADCMSRATGRTTSYVETSTKHLDCALNVLPDGRLLVKLDEITRQKDLLAVVDLVEPYLIAGGITDDGLEQLKPFYQRHEIITYSFLPNKNADIVLGTDVLTSNFKARSLAMLTNFAAVGNTIIGEPMPDSIQQAIGSNIRIISAKDVGHETFMFGDMGFVGGARCLTLPVGFTNSHTLKPAHAFSL